MHRCLLFAFGLLGIIASSIPLWSADWPQWQGIDRTAVSKETGLLKQWPKDGPTLAWKATKIGGGYSTPSIAKGRIYGMSYRGDDDVVWCLEEATGKELWVTRIAAKVKVGYDQGSRCTPTVDGDRLYCLGVDGDLACLDIQGKVIWQKSLAKDFGGRRPDWGYSESPLIDGDRVVVAPGGKAAIVALNKKTGETLWQAQVPGNDGAQYSSITVGDFQGTRQYIQFMKKGVVAVDAVNGKFLWRYDKPHNGTANISTPVYSDGHVFAASGYGTGGGLVKLTKKSDGFEAEEVYFTKEMKNHHGGMVLLGDYLYGSNEGLLTCLEFKTGVVKWAERKAGKGSIAYADGHLYYRNEGGPIILVEANPEKYVEKGRFNQPERSKQSAWPHPVIANGKLYIRDQDVLLCYDVKEKVGE